MKNKNFSKNGLIIWLLIWLIPMVLGFQFKESDENPLMEEIALKIVCDSFLIRLKCEKKCKLYFDGKVDKIERNENTIKDFLVNLQ